MAEEYDRDALAAEIEEQAAQLAAQAEPAADAADQVVEQVEQMEEATEGIGQHAKHAAPVVDEAPEQATEAPEQATAAFEPAVEEAPQTGEPTELIELPEQDEASQAMPTQAIDPATESIPMPVEGTTPMPNPFPDPQPTTPIPEPASNMSGFDVPVAAAITAEEAIPAAAPAASTPPFAGEIQANASDPYSAAAAAAAGVGAAAAAPAFAQAAPNTQQVPPQPVEPWRQAGQQGYQQATYANPDYRAGAYQGAVQHQPYAPDPTVNSYEQTMPAPLTQLTGGMKFGWLVVGFFLNIPGMVIAWLVNVDKHPQVKHDAIMWSVIGFVIAIVLELIASIVFAGVMVNMISALANSGYGGYYF